MGNRYDALASLPGDPATWRALIQDMSRQTLEGVIDLVANSAVTLSWAAPFDCEVKGISFRTDDKPSSALGTVVATITGAGNNLIAATNVDLEAQTDGTTSSETLTATTANRLLSKGDLILVTMTSDNADMADGTNQRCLVEVEHTPPS